MVDSRKKVLITGIAGFIGFHLAKKLVEEGMLVYGVDNINNYYPISLKEDRLIALGFKNEEASNKWLINRDETIYFQKMDLCDVEKTEELFSQHQFDVVVHLAAQPGVRLSISRPDLYFNGNIVATYNLFEVLKHHTNTRLIIGSSSSVYGKQEKTPYSETDQTDSPVSLYAATKKCVEVLAHYYAHQFGLSTTLLRFFTVYGPWGRPDMAVYGFFSKIDNGETIQVFNNGDLMRDFTYIDDIVLNIAMLIQQNNTSDNPFAIYNLGNESPVLLSEFISLIEKIVGKTAVKEYLPMQDGDVFKTFADSSKVKAVLQHNFHTPLEVGLRKFYEWYVAYHKPTTKINSLSQ
ncbi:MAG: NAD-dependent epimerase/dehydratase family protein [Bacteroidia bacterium]|nr:NAD-dependent epimerase/dehydratase family protein [Bacteroidia bacterium]